jgi:hypothetical protein
MTTTIIIIIIIVIIILLLITQLVIIQLLIIITRRISIKITTIILTETIETITTPKSQMHSRFLRKKGSSSRKGGFRHSLFGSRASRA